MVLTHFRRLSLLSFAAALPCLAVSPAAAAPAKASVVGLRVAKEVTLDEKPERAVHGMTAMGVSVLVEAPDGGLVQLVKDKCDVTAFKDDAGTDLLKAKPKFGDVLGSFPKFSKDRKACLVELRSDAVPAAGAKTIAIEGTLVFSAAAGKEAVKVASVKLAKGTAFKAGDVSFTVGAAGKPDWGDDPLQVSLKIRAAVDPVSAIRFLDASGQEIKSRRQGTMKGMGAIQWDYVLKKKVETATIEVTLWKGFREVTVPVKLSFGVGL
jgi:hypothetical protein